MPKFLGRFFFQSQFLRKQAGEISTTLALIGLVVLIIGAIAGTKATEQKGPATSTAQQGTCQSYEGPRQSDGSYLTGSIDYGKPGHIVDSGIVRKEECIPADPAIVPNRGASVREYFCDNGLGKTEVKRCQDLGFRNDQGGYTCNTDNEGRGYCEGSSTGPTAIPPGATQPVPTQGQMAAHIESVKVIELSSGGGKFSVLFCPGNYATRLNSAYYVEGNAVLRQDNQAGHDFNWQFDNNLCKSDDVDITFNDTWRNNNCQANLNAMVSYGRDQAAPYRVFLPFSVSIPGGCNPQPTATLAPTNTPIPTATTTPIPTSTTSPTPPLPPPPTNVSGQCIDYAGGNKATRIEWDGSANARQYQVARRVKTNGNWSDWGIIGKIAHQNITPRQAFVDYNTDPTQTYQYRVRACGDDACTRVSDWSDVTAELTCVIPTSTPIPTPTTVLKADLVCDWAIPHPVAGQETPLIVNIRNVGTGDAKQDFSTRFFVTKDCDDIYNVCANQGKGILVTRTDSSPRDPVMDASQFPIKAGNSRILSPGISIPGSQISPGTYYLTANLDIYGNVQEGDKANNTCKAQFIVPAGPTPTLAPTATPTPAACPFTAEARLYDENGNLWGFPITPLGDRANMRLDLGNVIAGNDPDVRDRTPVFNAGGKVMYSKNPLTQGEQSNIERNIYTLNLPNGWDYTPFIVNNNSTPVTGPSAYMRDCVKCKPNPNSDVYYSGKEFGDIKMQCDESYTFGWKVCPQFDPAFSLNPKVNGNTVSWDSVPRTGIKYALRIDRHAINGPSSWTGTCANVNEGDLCTDPTLTQTSYNQYVFQPGYAYDIWVNAVNTCGGWSGDKKITYNPTPVACTYDAISDVRIGTSNGPSAGSYGLVSHFTIWHGDDPTPRLENRRTLPDKVEGVLGMPKNSELEVCKDGTCTANVTLERQPVNSGYQISGRYCTSSNSTANCPINGTDTSSNPTIGRFKVICGANYNYGWILPSAPTSTGLTISGKIRVLNGQIPNPDGTTAGVGAMLRLCKANGTQLDCDNAPKFNRLLAENSNTPDIIQTLNNTDLTTHPRIPIMNRFTSTENGVKYINYKFEGVQPDGNNNFAIWMTAYGIPSNSYSFQMQPGTACNAGINDTACFMNTTDNSQQRVINYDLTFDVSQAGCENCVGATQRKFERNVWDDNNNDVVDNCSEACRAYFGPQCNGNLSCSANPPGTSNPGQCCSCLTSTGASCATIVQPTTNPLRPLNEMVLYHNNDALTSPQNLGSVFYTSNNQCAAQVDDGVIGECAKNNLQCKITTENGKTLIVSRAQNAPPQPVHVDGYRNCTCNSQGKCTGNPPPAQDRDYNKMFDWSDDPPVHPREWLGDDEYCITCPINSDRCYKQFSMEACGGIGVAPSTQAQPTTPPGVPTNTPSTPRPPTASNTPVPPGTECERVYGGTCAETPNICTGLGKNALTDGGHGCSSPNPICCAEPGYPLPTASPTPGTECQRNNGECVASSQCPINMRTGFAGCTQGQICCSTSGENVPAQNQNGIVSRIQQVFVSLRDNIIFLLNRITGRQ